MNFTKVAGAAVVGFLLGIAVFRLPTAKADLQQQGLAHIAIVPVAMMDAKTLSSNNLPGAKIVGISCIAKPEKRLPDAAVCYVATTLE